MQQLPRKHYCAAKRGESWHPKRKRILQSTVPAVRMDDVQPAHGYPSRSRKARVTRSNSGCTNAITAAKTITAQAAAIWWRCSAPTVRRAASARG